MARRADHNERREAFAMAALRVIMRAGVDGLTVREVAKEAGFTTGALTHYFTSKDQVLILASECSALPVRERMERAEREGPPLVALRKVVGQSLPITPLARGYWRVWVGFWERSSYNPEVARVMGDRYDEWRGRLARIIRRAQTEGVAAPGFDPELAAQELVAMVDGIGTQVLLGSGRLSVPRQWRIIDTWIELMAEGRFGRVAAPAAREPSKSVRGSRLSHNA